MVKRAGNIVITRRHIAVVGLLVAFAALALHAAGRPLICSCGEVKLWAGAVQSADNSQHLADWYTPSHIIHGFLFYALGWLVLRRAPAGEKLIMAVAIEASWELIENSKYIIDRYREATMALGYTGDSVINSVADIGWMILGFAIARRIPFWATIAIGVTFELLTLWVIRDNLTLNVLMLVWPIDAIRDWQGGA
jgi:hypothetical protein